MVEHDVLVIGGGSGLTAAWYAERDGMDVALVEPGPLGGTCVNRGCIPTKSLIESAEIMRQIERGPAFGIHVDRDAVEVDFPGIFARMRRMREEDVQETEAWIEGSDLITLYPGYGRFVDEKVLEVEGTPIRADHVFICTGASPLIPPIEGLDGVPYHTNETLLDEMTEQPDHLAVLGGGYIGLEFSHLFASLGTEVTVVEAKGCLLREDPDVRSLVTRRVQEYVNLHNGTYATAAREEDGDVVLELTQADTGKGKGEVRSDALLVATGRTPNTRDLDLDATDVKTDDRGWIEVDDQLRTTHPEVFAYGDVIGQGMFKHTSSTEGEVAYRASQGEDVTMDYRANPHVVFTHPTVASVGLTEDEAEAQDLAYRTAQVPYGGIAKGAIVGSPDGFAKAIVEERTDRILGFHVVGPQADLLVHEVVVAMTNGGTAADILDAIHVHPTLSELVPTTFTRA